MARKGAAGRYGTDNVGDAEMLQAGRRFPDRVWAVEGCNGIGRHLAHRLVHDGEVVVDVPAKLSAQVRVFATGNGRKKRPGRCALGDHGRIAHAGFGPSLRSMRTWW